LAQPSKIFNPDWPGYQLIFFDCDSTLSTIEGIDELARQKGKFAEVKQLTAAAMDGEVHLQTVYDRRLELLNPTRAEIRQLEENYRQTVVPDAAEVIQALQALGRHIFIVSGGLLEAVRPFGEWLGVPHQHIQAVAVRYNNLSGDWWDYEQDRWGQRPDVQYLDPADTPLIETEGKIQVIQEFRRRHPGRAMLIGDGVSDVVAKPAVDLMVGFGGVVIRERVVAEADIFIKSNSLAPVLPLALTQAEYPLLDAPYQAILQAGLKLMEAGEVTSASTNDKSIKVTK
jgi:phosphoserine phosphatase